MQTLISRTANISVAQFLQKEAASHGFDLVGVTSAQGIGVAGSRLKDFVAQGRHGTMRWLEERIDERADPLKLWPEVKSVVMFAMNYGPDANPLSSLSAKESATISVYAQNRDYHQLIKGRLKGIAGRLRRVTGKEVKVFVDTAPVMEKPLAGAAGLGWQGKHTNLVSRELGSWLFLGSIFSAAEIPANAPESNHCGNCRSCLDICPTKAFTAPYQLDARRCISYLTIEHEGMIAHEFRAAMGNRIYGCDDCLAVCPWNKFAQVAAEEKLRARDELRSPEIDFLLGLDDAAFRQFFSGSPIKRIGRERFIRNVLIAAGNSGKPGLRGQIERFLHDRSPVLRGTAIWAYAQLSSAREIDELARLHIGSEKHETVREEWHLALHKDGNKTK
jgi:epoxyqueuosine reductase